MRDHGIVAEYPKAVYLSNAAGMLRRVQTLRRFPTRGNIRMARICYAGYLRSTIAAGMAK